MTKMQCKFCPAVIDYIKEEKAAYEENGNKHDCPGLKKDPNAPKGFPKKWTKKEFKPVEGEMEIAAIKSEIQVLKTTVDKHDEAIRALVKELSFKTGKDVSAQLAIDARNQGPAARPKEEITDE